MADFQEQVMGITGLTIDASSTAPSRAEFSQFLNDGVIEVTQRCIQLKPQDAHMFQRESGEQTSNGYDLDGAQVVSVVRESGTNNDWRACRRISPDLQSRVIDVDSLHYASKFNPVYTVLDNNEINVFPAAGSDPNAFKVYYVNNSPVDSGGSSLQHDDSAIKYFPSDRVYLVVLFASMRSLQSAMAALHGDTNVTTAFTAIGTELNKVDEVIVLAKDQAAAFITSLGDIDDATQLFDATNKRFTEVKDGIDNAKLSLDTGFATDEASGSGNDVTGTKSIGYWLDDEDPEMVEATINAAMLELQRAQTGVAEIEGLLNSYRAELEPAPVYLQAAAQGIAQAQGYASEAQARMANLNQEYQWHNARYQQLKAEYDQAFVMMAPAQAQGGRR